MATDMQAQAAQILVMNNSLKSIVGKIKQRDFILLLVYFSVGNPKLMHGNLTTVSRVCFSLLGG